MKTRFEISPNATQSAAITKLLADKTGTVLMGDIWFTRNTVKIPKVGNVRIRSITDGNRFRKITCVKISRRNDKLFATLDGY